MLLQQSSKGQFCPSRRKGLPDASSSSWRDSRCHVVWLSQNLCAVDKLLSEAGIPGCQSGFLTLFYYVPTEFYVEKKRYFCIIPIGCRCTDKAALLQHTEMLMWALKPQEQVLLFCKKRELKLQSSNHWLFWRTVNAFDWQKHTEALQRSVSPTEIPGLTAQQASKGL